MPELIQCHEYVNADSIAASLSPFDPESTAIQAGRLMLERIHELAEKKVTFAFETTMGSIYEVITMNGNDFDIIKRFEIGVRRGVSKALERHKKLGQSVVIWRDGKVVKVPPEEIEVPPYPDDSELQG